MATAVGGRTFVFEQTQVTRHIALAETAGGFTVPDASGISDRHFEGIQAPGLIEGPLPVIFFRTRHSGSPRFSVRLNSTPLTQYTFANDDTRSWHEIIPAGALKAQDNELTFAVSGTGSVVFGDVVIMYTSGEITVKVPIVLSNQSFA